MPKNNETKFGKYFNLPNPGLRSYFGIVRSGQPDEYRTPFYKGRSLQEICNGWRDTLETISEDWPSLLDFENDLLKKVGPMSIMKPLSERMKDIDHYYEDIHLSSKPISSSAISAVIGEWKQVKGLRLRSQERTVEVMKKSTNSGSPYFTKRRAVVSKTVPCRFSRSGEDWVQYLPQRAWKAAAVLGWRGQEGGPEPDDVKQRVVWMFPFAVNVGELQMYQPLIEAAQRFNLVPAWVSMDEVDECITRMFDTKGKDDLVICTDFTKFDQHFGLHCQQCAETILRSLSCNAEDWFRDVFPIKYSIPLAYDYGKVRYGDHGMGSGSGGTNADETLVHRALQYEAAQNCGSRLNPYSQCLGDDGVLTFPGITVDSVVRSYTDHGLEMNSDKQYVSKHDCIYLRRWHHAMYRQNGVCVGVYSTYRALGRLAEQERFYSEGWSKEMVALRQLSILENVKYHPLKEKFADYCMAGDKYRLGLDIPGFLDNIEKIALEAIDNMPDFLGYTRSLQKKEEDAVLGMAGWWIVQYLKSKA